MCISRLLSVVITDYMMYTVLCLLQCCLVVCVISAKSDPSPGPIQKIKSDVTLVADLLILSNLIVILCWVIVVDAVETTQKCLTVILLWL